MTTTNGVRSIPAGKLALFTAADAPTLEETGMMDAMTYVESGADETPITASEIKRLQSGARLTVPFRQEGPGGFFLPAGQVYAYHAGPKGVKLLEFRNEVAFEMKVYEKDMPSYRAKAMESMASVK